MNKKTDFYNFSNARAILIFSTLLLVFFLANRVVAASPDVNVLYPQDGQSFNKDVISTIDVNVSVQDSDTNASGITIDLNFSTSQTEGTGTVIVNDANLATQFTCDSNNLATKQECKFTWNISGVANNDYFILAKVSDGTNTDFNAGAKTFTITTAEITISNTPMSFALDPAVADENGVNDLPFLIENTGGIDLDIAIDATAIAWQGTLNGNLYQFIAGNNEANSASSFDQIDWTDLFVTGASGTNDGVCQGLSFNSASNTINVGIKVKSPADEPETTSVTSIVTFYIAADTTGANDALVTN